MIDLFKKTEALLEGHFRLSSGLHSPKYLQCARVLQYPEYSQKLCAELAAKFKDVTIDVVVAPAIGGIVVSYEMARALGARSIFCEREEGKMRLRRGFAITKGEKALIVEDVITTGGSTKEVIEVAKNAGADIIGIASLVDRSGGKADFGLRFEALIKIDVPTYDPADCPLCKEGIAITKPGSRI
ncbi:MAG: orotate phosphoribosyltransferase [Candidatus Omnitrophica bacterium]|nr:orotate phosphoribosyltransferase [Candidatus Omnitrophota bacterium]